MQKYWGEYCNILSFQVCAFTYNYAQNVCIRALINEHFSTLAHGRLRPPVDCYLGVIIIIDKLNTKRVCTHKHTWNARSGCGSLSCNNMRTEIYQMSNNTQPQSPLCSRRQWGVRIFHIWPGAPKVAWNTSSVYPDKPANAVHFKILKRVATSLLIVIQHLRISYIGVDLELSNQLWNHV